MKQSYIVLLCAFLSSALMMGDGSCDPVYEFGLSPEDKSIIVDEHNKLRRLVSSPRAPRQVREEDFKEIKYDETLAEKAQDIANTCEFVDQMVADDRWNNVGQNMHIITSTGLDDQSDWLNAIKSWSDGYKYYKHGGPINSKNRNYAQMVSADIEFIGCGYTFYKTNDNKYKKLYTCSYGPAGNSVGQNPYEAAL